MKGTVRIHRKIMEDPKYLKGPFDPIRAWLDLIMLANAKTRSIFVRGVRITIRRGQVGWSKEKLAKRWGWSRNKVFRHLTELQKKGRIEQQKSNILSLITILKYDYYQGNEATESEQNGTDNGTQTIDNNEISEVNAKNESEYTRARERKTIYLYHVKLSDNEYSELVKLYGKQNVDDYIEKLDNHIGSKGAQYKSHFFTLRSWLKKDKIVKPKSFSERIKDEAKELGLECNY